MAIDTISRAQGAMVDTIKKPQTIQQEVTGQGQPTSQPLIVQSVQKSSKTNKHSKDSDSREEQSFGTNQQGGSISPEKVKTVMDELNKKMKLTHTECEYTLHEETNRISIKVIDQDSKEIIREIPPEKTLDMISKIWEIAGLLVDEKR